VDGHDLMTAKTFAGISGDANMNATSCVCQRVACRRVRLGFSTFE
jgi:hypothetical protein